MMKVFLTGAAGFVGSHVARLLVGRGCEIHALIRPGTSRERIKDIESSLNIIEGDLTSQSLWFAALKKARPQMCIHLAWIATPGVYLKSLENLELVGSTLRLARSLSDIGCKKLAGVGTCFEYDTAAGVLSESSPTRPRTLYAASKVALQSILDQFSKLTDMPVVWPRLFYIYGPGENERRLVPTLIRSCLQGVPVELSSADKVLDYLHVEDTASAIWAAASSDLTGPVNIGSGQAVTLLELSEKISHLTGTSGLFRFGAKSDEPDDPHKVLSDNRRLRDIGWTPKYSLDDGLQNVIDWWRRKDKER